MRKEFPGYYRPTKDEFAKLWQRAILAFDTSVLLNVYRYSAAARQEFTSILKQLRDRTWLPHQAASEFQVRRLDVIADQSKCYTELRSQVTKIRAKLDAPREHPFVSTELTKELYRVFDRLDEELETGETRHDSLYADDPAFEELTKLFEGRVGQSYDGGRLDEIYKLGAARYAQRIPPGYKDEDKGAPRMFGDLVLWNQLLDQAKAKKLPIIFVQDDRKEDWWLKYKNNLVGPRPELVHEVMQIAGVEFWMYQPDAFLRWAGEQLKKRVPSEAIREAKEVSNAKEAKAAKASEPLSRYLEEVLPADRFSADVLRLLQERARVADLESLKNAVEHSTIAGFNRLPPDALRLLQERARVADLESLRNAVEHSTIAGLNRLPPDALRLLQERARSEEIRQSPLPPAGDRARHIPPPSGAPDPRKDPQD